MRKFLSRAMDKVSRMNADAIRNLLRTLADENDRLETVLDSMMDGIIVCDVDHRPILINKSAERLIPISQTDLYETNLWTSVRDSELSDFFYSSLENEETILDREFALEGKQGTRIIAISITPLVKEKRITGTLIHIEETTEKRKKETRLRRAENLASLTTLAAGVAHEIKNPLGAISIHVQLLRKTLQPVKTAGMERYLSVVEEEIDRLNRIVVDFLFAVRPMDIASINDDLNGMLSELVAFITPETDSMGIQLDVKLEKDLPLLRFDKRYMKQALLNLVKNASAAMDQGGTLQLRSWQENDEVRILVKDNGTGIPEKNLGKIFEPYFTTKANGTGLGLTLTYKIIKEHGGDINVSSREGFGTEFIISLPIPQTEHKLITGRCADGEICNEIQDTDS
ncbi:MAG: PAS domain S-box protein [Spirochaetes bacterium]|nr:PAS domain S-box protein [Spirochaetota bacterium]